MSDERKRDGEPGKHTTHEACEREATHTQQERHVIPEVILLNLL